jgi:hypothetical protein
MPTIPLFTPTEDPDAWHQVRAPGGSEWWYLDAREDGADLRVVAILFDGCPVHPEYLRRYARYRRRPTRFAPPVPRDFPCIYFAIDRAGRRVARCAIEYPPGSLQPNQTGGVSVGPHSIVKQGDRLVFSLNDSSATATLRVMSNRCDVEGEVRMNDARPMAFAGRAVYVHQWRTAPLDLDQVRRGRAALLHQIESAIARGVFTSSPPAASPAPRT